MSIGPIVCDAGFCSSPPFFEERIDAWLSRIKDCFEQRDYSTVQVLFDTIQSESLAEYATGEINPRTGKRVMNIPGFILDKIHDAYHIMGQVYISEGQLESAERLFQHLENENCIFNLSVPYNLACIKSLQGKTEEMYTKLRQVLNLNPEYVQKAKTDDDFRQYHKDSRFEIMMHEAKLLSR
ncbi:hypothetical protein KY338_06560 [Candidatus Woesearchaeota archaeon]|nr:hypothetical protein [Candidatus Woesearchaeota archaeon]MBW3006412.1 hypothetical protein [Candidatus Woesearchaeota archaeon]